MARIHQFLQTGRSAVGILNSKQKGPVIAPISRTGKLSDGHDLDSCYSRAGQFVKLGDNRFESSLRSEGADVQFINDVVFDRQAEPVLVLPIEPWIDHFGRTVHS